MKADLYGNAIPLLLWPEVLVILAAVTYLVVIATSSAWTVRIALA